MAVMDGGKGMIEADILALRMRGVSTWFECKAVELVMGDEGKKVEGLVVEREVGGKQVREVLRSEAVVLAAGGYEASREKRRQHLGEAWENARVSSISLVSLANMI